MVRGRSVQSKPGLANSDIVNHCWCLTNIPSTSFSYTLYISLYVELWIIANHFHIRYWKSIGPGSTAYRSFPYIEVISTHVLRCSVGASRKLEQYRQANAPKRPLRRGHGIAWFLKRSFRVLSEAVVRQYALQEGQLCLMMMIANDRG